MFLYFETFKKNRSGILIILVKISYEVNWTLNTFSLFSCTQVFTFFYTQPNQNLNSPSVSKKVNLAHTINTFLFCLKPFRIHILTSMHYI